MDRSGEISRYNGESDTFCEGCGAPFVPTTKRQRFCTTACNDATRIMRFKVKKRNEIIKRGIDRINDDLRAAKLEEFTTN